MTTPYPQKLKVALVGNPNVGKSTLFNTLTGLRQHTGNWPGKTVDLAQGRVKRPDIEFTLVDLPGTYSLDGKSEDERITAYFLEHGQVDCIVVVCDGSCLERSLFLALQVLQKCPYTVICVNLMDEAKRYGIEIDSQKLSEQLHAPVILTAAGQGDGLEALLQQVVKTACAATGQPLPHWDEPISAAHEIAQQCTHCTHSNADIRREVDRLLVSRKFGVPLMFLMLLFIIWLTVWGANYPSMLLEKGFDWGYGMLNHWLKAAPWWLRGVLVDGVYATSARVISVMLPPMAIFFPLFTVLEDIGYLPRMAFLLDPGMERCGGCGKQALTMCMGLGCNAVGVMGCRIIDDPSERLAAILTNAMVPCNGRFPTLIVLGAVFFPELGSALIVAACVALGMAGAMATSGVLNKTVLHTKSSTFIMEMPPFRRPRLGRIFLRSLLDRTLFIAGRALSVAAPAGVLLWALSVSGWLGALANVLDPIGTVLGLNGIILVGFCMAIPANELLIPVILMIVTGTQSLQAAGSIGTQVLLDSSLTWQMAICTMVFTLFHWPCSTTLMTIYRETRSIKNTAAAFIVPTAVGCMLCGLLHLLLG